MKQVNMKIMSKIKDFLNYFDISYIQSDSIIHCACPIHRGDNPTAFNINIDSDHEFYGVWFCNTNGCHTKYGQDPFALIRCLLSTYAGAASFKDTRTFVDKFTQGVDIEMDLEDFNSSDLNKMLIKQAQRKKRTHNGIKRSVVRSHLNIPAQYYLDLGFSSETLDLFDVGLCSTDGAEMYGRVVFPVYDDNDEYMIGCVGRTVTNQTEKWKNQKGFNKANHLYNYNKAKEHIKEKGTIILCEGQADVMRLWDAGLYHTVGIFGSNLSESQEYLIQKSGAFNIIVITDNDEAGRKCFNKIKGNLKNRYNIVNIIPSKKDVGEMTVDQIHKMILPQMKGYY